MDSRNIIGNGMEARQNSRPDFLDMDTIRRRVAMIKSGWSDDTARSRAKEGIRRRQELEELLWEDLCDLAGSEETCDLKSHGFSLVG